MASTKDIFVRAGIGIAGLGVIYYALTHEWIKHAPAAPVQIESPEVTVAPAPETPPKIVFNGHTLLSGIYLHRSPTEPLDVVAIAQENKCILLGPYDSRSQNWEITIKDPRNPEKTITGYAFAPQFSQRPDCTF